MIANGMGLGYLGQAAAYQGFRNVDLNRDGVLDNYELRNMMGGHSNGYHHHHHGYSHHGHYGHHHHHSYPNYYGSWY